MRLIRASPDDGTSPAPRGAALTWVIASAFAIGISLLGCRKSLPAPIPSEHQGEARPRPGGTLRLASFQDIRNLDPAGPSDALALQAEHLIFAGLIDFDDRAEIVPDLADHWDTEDGGRAYRFFLRQNVAMHDGEELTAEDVKRSAERALNPATPDPNASYFDDLVGYEEFSAARAQHIDGIVIEGRYVVSFHLKEPDATFLPILTLHTLRPVCRTAGTRYSDTWLPCGAGPFKLLAGDWKRGTSLRLVRHEAYFRPGVPYLDAVEWTFNMPLLAQRFRFEAGELDAIRDLTQADQRRFAADPRWRPLGTAEADTSVYGESMNTRMPPFDNVEVRRAVAAAINREHYRLLKPGYLTVLTQLVPPGVPGHDPGVEDQRYDYAAALEHMRKAGYPYDPNTGKGGWPRRIDYPLFDGGLLVFTAQLLQQDLARIGLRIELKLMSWQAFLAVQERPLAAALSQANWQMDYPDPSSFFDPLFTTRAIGPESGHNTAFYSNARVDDLVARARREIVPDRRRQLYREASTILCDEAPWAFAYAAHFFHVHQPYVHAYRPHPVWPLEVSATWMDRAGRVLERALGRGAL
jgi:ABC-type transport system substrate-binding protein